MSTTSCTTKDTAVSRSSGSQRDIEAISLLIQAYAEGGRKGEAATGRLARLVDSLRARDQPAAREQGESLERLGDSGTHCDLLWVHPRIILGLRAQGLSAFGVRGVPGRCLRSRGSRGLPGHHMRANRLSKSQFRRRGRASRAGRENIIGPRASARNQRS